MASNSFGTLFRITTFGESHGKAIGVVVDGCPAGLEISESDINQELALRAPGKNPYTSPRKETDVAELLSGVFEGRTTGAPICILIRNQDYDSSKYAPLKNIYRPGHANFTYLEKYGIFDHRGSGRASARETACRVAAGAVARKLLHHFHIEVLAYLKQMGDVEASVDVSNLAELRQATYQDAVYCPDANTSSAMCAQLERLKIEGDSVGGVVEFVALSVPAGLGDPIYEKLEAKLASAMLSLPASKGFEIGSGFNASVMSGSAHNDTFISKNDRVQTSSNYAGGTLGGISTGMPLVGRVAFKPASSIKKSQQTLDLQGNQQEFTLPEGSRHDPCVAIRAVPVVEAMTLLVLADALLLNRSARL
jgi:chorismate synthase